MTYGSLFSGAGGFDLGADRAGFTCSWQVEIDSFCQRILSKHWPHVRRHDDIRTFTPDDSWRVDACFGGFPCKQTSNGAAIHGKRSGLKGKDSGLWFEMLRVVRLLRPCWVVVENVSGAAAWSSTIKGGLESLGYALPDKPCRLSAADFGLPHRRWRLFWIANRDGQRLSVPRPTRPPAAPGIAWGAAERNPWLSSLTRDMRVDDGVPGTLDRAKRIERIGNAVVPAMAEWIARRILASE